jgi:S-adenosylmethionine synthetase
MNASAKSKIAAAGRHETAEFVLPGHPDKLCDAVADAIIDWHQPLGQDLQFGLEVACVFDRVFITGRIANPIDRIRLVFPHHRDRLVRETYASAGYGTDAAGHVWGPRPEDLKIDWALCLGGFAEGERELRHLSDDQAICVGYALRSPATDYLPPAHWLARRIGRELHRLRVERGAGQIGPDAKVIVHGTRIGSGGSFRPDLVSVSLNHHEQSDWLLLRRVVEEAVETACVGMDLPEIEMNGAGMFVAGGPNGDNGTTGKKLVVDAYGPGIPIGGGAWSGKDFFKVDRLGGMAARRVALESLLASDAEEALVTLTCLPGGDRPARIDLLLDGTASDRVVVPAAFGALESRVLHDVFAARTSTHIDLARWGHQQPGMPWELPAAASADG